MSEQDLRPKILNALLTTPHRDLNALYPVHAEIAHVDPVFYAHLAAWYEANGSVRDHNEVFVTVLALSQSGFREVGLALLRKLPPYQVARVVDFIKGRQRTVRVLRAGMQPLKRVKGARPPTREEQDARYETRIETAGLFRLVPRSLRTEIARYLRERERDAQGLDRTILTARTSLKHLYATLRLKPGARADAILFKDQPPTDSALYVIQQLGRASTPDEQAQAIVDNRIPYRVAVGVIKSMTPLVLAALINSMTPAELLNNMASLTERGALQNPDLKSLIDSKVALAATDKRVAPLRAQRAKAAMQERGEKLSDEMDAALTNVTQQQVTARGKITRATAVFIDKSASQDKSIEVGKRIATLVAAICTAPLVVYAFDTVAYPIKTRDHATTLDAWDKAFMGVRAVGGTSCGVALGWMAKQRELVEQIVIVTDECEHQTPLFEEGYQMYAQAMNVKPSVTVVRVAGNEGLRTSVQDACRRLGVDLHVMDFSGDYFSLPNILPMLSQASLSDMVMEILSYPLPERRVA